MCRTYFIIEEVHWGPLDTLPEVFFLFTPESELNEELLKFFVAVVDAKLLDAILLENLEAVYIEEAHQCFLVWILRSQGVIDLRKGKIHYHGSINMDARLYLEEREACKQLDEGTLISGGQTRRIRLEAFCSPC